MSNDQTTKTARDLITGALRKIGQYAPGESLDPNDAQDALDTLNGMLDLWSNQRLAVYNQIETVQNLTSGQASYTIGSGGYFNIERPYRIAKCYSRLTTSNSNVDFPCDVMTLEKYGDIGLKNQPGPWPKELYYNSGWPQGTLIVWPVPSSNVEFHLWTDQVFSAADLSTTIALPRGYFLGLQYSLAELLCSEYGLPVPPDIKRFAGQFVSVLKDQNATPQAEVPLEPTLLSGGNSNDAGWILHGGFR
jgi:hypothetical protein